MRVLVIYAYCETARSRDNLEFFNRYGLYLTEKIEYCLVVNGGICSVNLSSRWQNKILRNNQGHDFGAWKEGLANYKRENFDYFIFLNDTVIGPLGERNWIKVFTDRIDDSTKLVGTTINSIDMPRFNTFGAIGSSQANHVQSMFWVTDQQGCQIAEEKIFPIEVERKDHLVVLKEIGLSLAILEAGYNIACLLSGYQVDFRQGNHSINNSGPYCGDPYYPGCHFGKNIHPLEVIFFKNNRYEEPLLDKIISLQKGINYY